MKPNHKQLILEDFFSGHQKVHLYVFALIGIAILAPFVLYAPGFTKIIGVVGLLVWVLFSLSVIFIKRGFLKNQEGIHIGYFAWNKCLIKEPIGLLNKQAVTVLKFRRSQKLTFISAANPDFAATFNAFDIYLLNENHTQKEKLMPLKKEENAAKAIAFLTENSKLKHEVYSPVFD